jgi:hypothetical protein
VQNSNWQCPTCTYTVRSSCAVLCCAVPRSRGAWRVGCGVWRVQNPRIAVTCEMCGTFNPADTSNPQRLPEPTGAFAYHALPSGDEPSSAAASASAAAPAPPKPDTL